MVWLGKPITESNWEPVSKLPSSMVQEYENGIQRNICSSVSISGGHSLCTISATLQGDNTETVLKKPRLDIESSNSG